MARRGDVIESPVHGHRLRFLRTARDAGGELLEVDSFYEPRGYVGVYHLHRRQEERTEVVSGTLNGRVAGEGITLGPGQSVAVPAGTPHDWWNGGDEDVHARVEFQPALDIETFFETIFGLARDGKLDDKGAPGVLQGAVLLREYDICLSGPPIPVQRALFAVLAPVGRLLVYEARYFREAARAMAKAVHSKIMVVVGLVALACVYSDPFDPIHERPLP